MNCPYADQFSDAIDEELNTLEKMNTWDKFRQEPGMNILKSTWAFKIKKSQWPNSEIQSPLLCSWRYEN